MQTCIQVVFESTNVSLTSEQMSSLFSLLKSFGATDTRVLSGVASQEDCLKELTARLEQTRDEARKELEALESAKAAKE